MVRGSVPRVDVELGHLSVSEVKALERERGRVKEKETYEWGLVKVRFVSNA